MARSLLHAAAAASGRTLWLIDSGGALAEPSPSWRAFTGQPDGADWREALHPEDRAAASALWSSTAAASVECRVLRPNGKHTRATISSAPVDGSPLRVCSLDEVWVDASVRQSEERLRLATQAANVAIWEYDFVAGQMTRTDNHDGLYGLPKLQVWTYDAFTNATHPDDRELSNQVVQRSVVPGGPDHYAMDFRVVWPDGSVHWLACTGDVVRRDAEGKATLVRGTLSDVTRLKAVEADLRAAVQVRDDFLQIASHELNTPLTPLGIKLERMRRRGPNATAEELERDLAMAFAQYKRLGALVNELLDVTRLSQGRLELSRQKVDLAAIVRSVAETFAAQHRADIAVEGGRELTGEWDVVRLEQIVENLLSNAVKYGQGKPIRVVLSRVGGRARLDIIDQGIGIEPDALARIFDKFERAPSGRPFGGLGLGLYIVKELVAQHGGEVRVKSAPGEGSTFTVELPHSAAPLS